MRKDINKDIFRCLTFLLVGMLIFNILQYVFIPKRPPYDNKTFDEGKMRYYLGEERNNIEVLIFGTSHPARGIFPMEMYESYGIKSYNLSTTIQPLEVTYYMLQEATKSQRPKVIVWDVSNLYINYEDSACWKLAMDDMPIGKNKKFLVERYMEIYNNEGESFIDLMFPLLEYHTRWKELVKQDFSMLRNNKHYFAKGGQINSTINKGFSVDYMNSITDELKQNTIKDIYEYKEEEFCESHEDNALYDIYIDDSNLEWILRIKQMCDANNIQLLAVKVPSVYDPYFYSSAWTTERCEKTHMVCEKYGIVYYDLLYDTDINFDYEKDSFDSGMHLNLYGAQKVSANLGNYLKEHYELSEEHNEQWDKDLMSYQKVRKIALLELEQDFTTYINLLADEYKDKMIFMATSGYNIAAGLNEADKAALKTLGLRIDFSGESGNSFIAVIDNGKVKYEALSNRALDYSGVCDKSKKNYNLCSDGRRIGSIKLNGGEYVVGADGLNIVVYDDERGLVLDSVNFDTCAEYHTPIRNDNMINQMEQAFESYIMEVEDR